MAVLHASRLAAYSQAPGLYIDSGKRDPFAFWWLKAVFGFSEEFSWLTISGGRRSSLRWRSFT